MEAGSFLLNSHLTRQSHQVAMNSPVTEKYGEELMIKGFLPLHKAGAKGLL